eukprot:1351346-Heterocapsa_arctica.AAC.1
MCLLGERGEPLPQDAGLDSLELISLARRISTKVGRSVSARRDAFARAGQGNNNSNNYYYYY